jgi:competence protein ComEA
MSRFALSPRAALLLVGAVLLVAVGVVVVGAGAGAGSGAGSAGGDGVAVVTGAPTAGPAVSSGPPASVLPSSSASSGASATPGAAVVYVVGAVAHAGVVRVPAGARVDDAVAAAGGATAEADLSRVNLARPVVDGERLYVPTAGETEVPAELPVDAGAGASSGSAAGAGSAGGAGGAAAGAAAGSVVDLNTADATTLETLPGIGPALAQRILAWRDEHGGFRSVEDLLEVSGIGDARFADLRERVRV